VNYFRDFKGLLYIDKNADGIGIENCPFVVACSVCKGFIDGITRERDAHSAASAEIE
jgi:hypothetical protein